MPQLTLLPSPANIVIIFDAWLKANHLELLQDDPTHLLSIIENKWNSLVKDYISSNVIKYRKPQSPTPPNDYPETEE